MKRILALGLATCLGGCAVAPSGAATRAHSICPDRGVKWFERPTELGRVLVLGMGRDPSTTGGRLEAEPFHTFQPAYLWLEAAPVVFINMQPRDYPASVFAPRAPEPEGVYRIEAVPAPDPRCAAYDLHLRKLEDIIRPMAVTPAAPPGTCLRYEYVGPVVVSDYDFVRITYQDTRSPAPQVRRWVHELRRPAGEVVARGVEYMVSGRGRKSVCVSPPPVYPEQRSSGYPRRVAHVRFADRSQRPPSTRI